MGTGADDGEAADTDNVESDIEAYIASNYGDAVTGTANNDVFYSGTLADSFSGLAGDDTFVAAFTSGTSSAVDGSDYFDGGAGNDTIDYSSRASSAGYGVYVDLGAGTSSTSGYCVFSGTSTWTYDNSIEADQILNVENAFGTPGDDEILGNSGPNVLLGFGGYDNLQGLAGDDQVDANSYVGATSTATCNPMTMLYVGTRMPCALPLTVTGDSHATLDCGGDPLDIGSNSGNTSTTESNCKIMQ